MPTKPNSAPSRGAVSPPVSGRAADFCRSGSSRRCCRSPCRARTRAVHGAARLCGTVAGRDLPSRAGSLCAALRRAVAHHHTASAIWSTRATDPISRPPARLCAQGPARHSQDARLPALSRMRRASDGKAALHRLVRTAAFHPQGAVPFFVDRFPYMDWLIATPIGTAIWQDGALSFGPPAQTPPEIDDVCSTNCGSPITAPPSIRRACASKP